MLNVTKKSVQILFMFILIIAAASCTVEERVDFSELIRRMSRQEDTYGIAVEEAFFSDDEWFLFVELQNSENILVTGKEDESRLLTRVCVSIVTGEMQGKEDVFLRFCENAASAFVKEGQSENVLSGSHIYDDGVLFSDGAYFSEYGRYKTSLFTADAGNTFVIELIR